jgi:hypothetical protein
MSFKQLKRGKNMTNAVDEKIPPLNLLFLWRLFLAGGEGWKDKLKPDLKTPARTSLVELGLIKVWSQDRRSPKGDRKVKALRVKLTDEGWNFLRRHVGDEFSARSSAAGPVLNYVMGRLAERRAEIRPPLEELLGLSLAAKTSGNPPELELEPEPEPPTPPAPQPAHTPDEALRRLKALDPRLFMAPYTVRLKDVRAALSDWPREVLDQSLLTLQRQGQLVLFKFDDPARIGPEDKAAALYVAGAVRHYIYLH